VNCFKRFARAGALLLTLSALSAGRAFAQDDGGLPPSFIYSISNGLQIATVNQAELYQPNFDEGYAAGYDVGYDSGFASGRERGTSTGTADGRAAGYPVGWNATYQPAYDAAYAVQLPIGHEAGWTQGLSDGFEKGNAWYVATYGSLTINNSNSFSGSIFVSGGNPSGDPGTSNGTLTISLSAPITDFARYCYDRGYESGKATGKAVGATEGYDFAYPTAYTAGYDAGYANGTAEGASDGTKKGTDAGFHSGWELGYVPAFDQGFTEGAEAARQSRPSTAQLTTLSVPNSGLVNSAVFTPINESPWLPSPILNFSPLDVPVLASSVLDFGTLIVPLLTFQPTFVLVDSAIGDATVPEPATIVLGVLATVALGTRRRR
jgi:hypothetical protein